MAKATAIIEGELKEYRAGMPRVVRWYALAADRGDVFDERQLLDMLTELLEQDGARWRKLLDDNPAFYGATLGRVRVTIEALDE